MENVCLSVDDDSFMYAVGSKAHTDLLDARTLQVNRYCNKCSKHSDLNLFHKISLIFHTIIHFIEN